MSVILELSVAGSNIQLFTVYIGKEMLSEIILPNLNTFRTI